jgi:hypothetical protein
LIAFIGATVWIVESRTPAKTVERVDAAAAAAEKVSAPTGLAALSKMQLANATIEYARKIREFEGTARTQMDVTILTGDPPVPGDFRENVEARTQYSKLVTENRDRQMAKRYQMEGAMQLTFRNEYAQQGRELEAELKMRLAREGILPSYGKDSERMVLDGPGFFAGNRPISNCADYLERNARRLAQ